jgi:hypothetical protein
LAVISELKKVVKVRQPTSTLPNKGFKFPRSVTDGGEPAQEFAIAETKSLIHLEYANKIFTKVRELSQLVHDLRNEDKAFIDSLDIDARLIRKGRRISSLEALRKRFGWQDNDILDQVSKL